MSQNFGHLELTSQSMINKSIQIMFVMLKLYINKPVEVLTRNMMDLHDAYIKFHDLVRINVS
jgi:hypothetical protein